MVSAGLSEESSSSVLNLLQSSDRLFRDTCKDSVTVVEPAEDKNMEKFL